MRTPLLHLGSCLLLAAATLLTAVEPTPDPDHITRHATALMNIGDRSPGSPGAERAARYLEGVLRDLTDEVALQRTVFQEPVDHGSSLSVGEEELAVYPHRLNGISPSTTYGEAITGSLIFAGKGSLRELEKLEIRDNIVVLDGDSEHSWTNVARLGAAAIIFRHPEHIDQPRLAAQSARASVDFPRFVAAVPDAWAGREATLISDVRWTTVEAETVVAVIRGTQEDPEGQGERRDALMLSSGYESGGVVRGLAPGATRAWNAGLLLELARQFAADPLEQDLVVTFHGARQEFHRGLRQLCAAHCDVRRRLDVEELGLSYTKEEVEQTVRLHDVVAELNRNIDSATIIKAAFTNFIRASEQLADDQISLDEEDLLAELRSCLGARAEEEAATAATGTAAAEDEGQEADEAGAYYAIRFGSGDDSWGLGWKQLFWGAVLLIVAVLLARAVVRGRITNGKTMFGLCLTWVLLFAWNAISIPHPPGEQYVVDIDEVESDTYRFLADQAARYADAIKPELKAAYHAVQEATTESEKEANEQHAVVLNTRSRIWRNLQQKLGNKTLQSGLHGQDVFEVDQAIDEVNECKLLPQLMADLVQAENASGPSLDRHVAVMQRQRDAYQTSLDLWHDLPDLHVTYLLDLDLSDGNRWFTTWTGTKGFWWDNKIKWIHKVIEGHAREVSEAQPDLRIHYDYSPHDSDEVPSTFQAASYIPAAAHTNRYLNSISLTTINDLRHKLGSPQDNAGNFHTDNFLAQTEGLTALFRHHFADRKVGGNHAAGFTYGAPFVSPEVKVESPSEGSITGRRGHALPYVVVSTVEKIMGLVPDKPEYLQAGDVRFFETYRGNAFGTVRVPHIYKQNKDAPRLVLGAYGRDQAGRLTEVIAYSGTRVSKIGGTKSMIWDISSKTTDDKLLLLFNAKQSALFDIFDPRVLTDLATVKVYSASRDASPNYSYFEFDAGTAAVFSPANPGIPLRILAGEGQIGNRFTLVGTPAEKGNYEDFVGLPAGGILSESTSFDVAEDMWQLNEKRLSMLRSNGVRPSSLTRLHSTAERFLQLARDQREAGNLQRSEGAATSSWAISERVYPAVKETAQDVVRSLVIMLLFSIPLALILERLLIAGNTIYRKVIGFTAFFALTFLFFYFFHPAFAIAKTPIIIFLAFVIMAASVMVIGILVNRFEYEMENIRMAGLGLHKVDVSRLGTLVATITLGVSNMRRRPLRTFLTAITVVLMTFILMTFASFNSGAGFRVNANNHTPGYNAILFTKPGWRDINHRTLDYFQTNWSDQFTFYPHYWLMQGDGRRDAFYINTESGKPVHLEGMIGIEFDDPTGIEDALIRPDTDQRGFGEETDWVFLPSFLLQDEDLGLTPGGTITVYGQRLRIGIIDAKRLGRTLHVNGKNVTPLLAQEMTKEQRDQFYRMAESAASDGIGFQSSFAHVSANSVCVLHNSRIRNMEALLHGILMVPKDPNADLRTIAEDMATEIAFPITVAADGDSYQIISVDKLAVAGMTDVAIPLVLGGLIIFATMLSSVAERGKEIFIYASLGLAPLHIGTLFLVEASIYAVIGGMGGYMLAQLIGSGLGYLSSLGWVAQPDLNFSSMTAVITMLLVMGTVLISALYPAIVASKSANPGDKTSDFTIPEPDGDSLEIPFPFTVSSRDAIGLLAYLRHYLDSHTEASVGCFTAAEAELAVNDDDYRVRAKIWLAPFDLGISQRFTMLTRPTDMPAIYAVHISLVLLSGQRSAWTNVLGPYLQDLRQQFLVWRTLDDETRDRYRALGGDREAAARVEQRQRDGEEARQRRMEEDRTRKKRREDEMKAKAGDREAIERIKAAEAEAAVEAEDTEAALENESRAPAQVDPDQAPSDDRSDD